MTPMRQILQRGISRGEFQVSDPDYAVYAIVAPMLFLAMSQHSKGACTAGSQPLDPLRYLETMIDTILLGLCARPETKKEHQGT